MEFFWVRFDMSYFVQSKNKTCLGKNLSMSTQYHHHHHHQISLSENHVRWSNQECQKLQTDLTMSEQLPSLNPDVDISF